LPTASATTAQTVYRKNIGAGRFMLAKVSQEQDWLPLPESLIAFENGAA